MALLMAIVNYTFLRCWDSREIFLPNGRINDCLGKCSGFGTVIGVQAVLMIVLSVVLRAVQRWVWLWTLGGGLMNGRDSGPADSRFLPPRGLWSPSPGVSCSSTSSGFCKKSSPRASTEPARVQWFKMRSEVIVKYCKYWLRSLLPPCLPHDKLVVV